MTRTRRDRYLQQRYGITEKEYERLERVHQGRCWICGKKPKRRRLHVDHDHKKKGRASIRGLLCWHCNAGLARFGDDPERLRAAASYVVSRKVQEILDAQE